LSELLADVKDRFARQGFRSKITVDDTGIAETITIVLFRDNTFGMGEMMIT